MFLGPFFNAAQPQEVAVVFEQFAEAGAGHSGELISVSLEVPDASLPSRMFCLPERAA
jgi:hypothetical protein